MKQYKQYLHGDMLGQHVIYTTRKGWIRDASETVIQSDYRESRVWFAADKDAKIPPEEMLVFSVPTSNEGAQKESDPFYAQYYTAALGGAFADRRLVTVELHADRIELCFGVFDEEGKQVGVTIVDLDNLPKGMMMVVDLEPLTGAPYAALGAPDTYQIRNLAEAGEPMQLEITEICVDKLCRIKKLGEDEKGKFEIVMEYETKAYGVSLFSNGRNLT